MGELIAGCGAVRRWGQIGDGHWRYDLEGCVLVLGSFILSPLLLPGCQPLPHAVSAVEPASLV